MEVEELGLPHPRHVWEGGGGLPAVGQDDAHQAREDHGCKRRGTVMLTSTKDTVNIPVKMYTMECTFESCTYDATEHWSGTKEELLYILEEHVRTEHPMPTTELVEGHVTRKAWETFRDWWADYRDMSAYHEQVYGSEKDVRNFLSTFIGEAGGMVLQELGMDKFMVLTGAQMLKETERIAVQGGAVDKERRLYELPSGCQIPHFKSNELMGIKWAGFRQRLGEQKEQFSLTDRELVRSDSAVEDGQRACS
jgi:hypothetical protein